MPYWLWACYLIAATLLWVLPPIAIVLLGRTAVLRPNWTPASRNAWFAALFAAAMVLVFFDVLGVVNHGPWSAAYKRHWQWRIPWFSVQVAIFAALAAWSCTVCYMELRARLRRHGHSVQPQPWQVIVALLLIFTCALYYNWRLGQYIERRTGQDIEIEADAFS